MRSKYTDLNHISNYPQATHSPLAVKRRRLSHEEAREGIRSSSSSISRLRSSPEQSHQRLSPTTPPKTTIHHPALLPTLPSITPSYNLERGPSNPLKRPASAMSSEGTVRTYRNTANDENLSHIPRKSQMEPYQASRHYEHSYNHPSKTFSLSSSPNHRYEHAPFSSVSSSSSSSFNPHYQDNGRYGELGVMTMGTDTKMRKRRGNLPKETTDKLRSWFVAHLQHPYPTEDEKQELMRQTGLQMSMYLFYPNMHMCHTNKPFFLDQISNWFINARRRQLPTMINNARAETDAMNSRGHAALAEPKDYMSHSRRDLRHLSEGEEGRYDDDLQTLRQHRADLKRESV